ncbi:MAG TPA: hypothetical protein VNV85_02035, partial [Puia sp.]|nr:hypothetical protein [Puia sp.]
MKTKDLSTIHHLISDLFQWPKSSSEWDQYRITKEQVHFFNENGFLAGLKMIDEKQSEGLRGALNDLMDADHPGHELFYEFNSNESSDANKVLFHALGAWRIAIAFHDVLWNPRFVMAASQLLG